LIKLSVVWYQGSGKNFFRKSDNEFLIAKYELQFFVAFRDSQERDEYFYKKVPSNTKKNASLYSRGHNLGQKTVKKVN